MKTITFIDTEVDRKSLKVADIGAITEYGNKFHSGSISEFVNFLKGSQFICGHNIINHDLKYIQGDFTKAGIINFETIDTLFLSPLLFPKKPYHNLVKDDKLQYDDENNPLNDSIKAKDLFFDEISAFSHLDNLLKDILFLLLKDQKEFSGFFKFINYQCHIDRTIENLIFEKFNNLICSNIDINKFITEKPVELAYCLALINSDDRNSITPNWVLFNYPSVQSIMMNLRNKPCMNGCDYCKSALDINKGLKKYFGFESFRKYAGKPLQEDAVKAAIENKSILVIFPTGGGKSITFQVPALMIGENIKGLTLVISPLQSLMKDQVDNLEKSQITEAVTINGLLDPIERAKSIQRVEDGSASLLYISPESLRSKTIESLILGRKIARFVIDEAHCFSSWGQDFRVDYLYIGDFIKQIQEKKNLEEGIPVSCFTATAKQNVIDDIRGYFKEKLSLDLEIISTNSLRTNLNYQVFNKETDEEKYRTMRDLIDSQKCPTIIYVSRTHKAISLADRLTKEGFSAKPFHGKMKSSEKTANQNSFISGEIQIIVATSAFGMGVDKKDVGMVIHYDISDSLENYIQEAGRAGRDENMKADCYVLFNEEDLSKHFILLNQTKLSIKEIQQIWKAIKEITKVRSKVSNSVLEIARKAGWDEDIKEIETRVTTAIAALENAGYLKRGQNMPKIFANSILARTAQDAIDKINLSDKFNDKQKQTTARIIRKLFSSRSRKKALDELPETRIDYISDHLGIVKEEVIKIINLLREEKILADTKDLTAFIKKGENKNHSLNLLKTFIKIENYLKDIFNTEEKTYSIKDLNECAENEGYENISTNKIRTIINLWTIKNWIEKQNHDFSKNHVNIHFKEPKEQIDNKLLKRHSISEFIVEYLYNKSNENIPESDNKPDEVLIEFSVHELKENYEKRNQLFKIEISLDDIEDALFYLSRIEAIKIEGGFLVIYNKLDIERLEKNPKIQYKADDYQKLNQFYENKIQQIHIVGEYAKKMIDDYKGALTFVEDYFQLNYTSFLNKYFPGSRQNEIKKTLTPSKFNELFGSLSSSQLDIIKDNQSKYIVVAAGPGSGKTKLLVHKLASLLLMEDVKHEQLLMLTFSRAAVTEFKKRLQKLIGNAACYIDIKTFHSFCFDLLGKVGNLEKSDSIVRRTVDKIKEGEIEINKITKTVIVIDEAQDIDSDEYDLINALIEHNEEMRLIAVGDDDQNIYGFRGSDSKYLEQFIINKNAKKYELSENFRSYPNLIHFTNQFAETISKRLKKYPVYSKKQDYGTINLINYNSVNLIVPVVEDIIKSELSGLTCILTRTNDEAFQITGLLMKKNIPVKLIQSNDKFNLFNLCEIRDFLNKFTETDIVINDELWDQAKKDTFKKFQASSKFDILKNILSDFENTNPKKKYKSDFELFIKESKLEDFYSKDNETILVSTIHKSKGKEFDNVFLILDNYDISKDESKRALYVAMTRAKKFLSIHTNQYFLNNIKTENLTRKKDIITYNPPDILKMQLYHEHVNLGYFKVIQHRLNSLISGNLLIKSIDGYSNDKGETVLKFSKKYCDFINDKEKIGYKIKEVKAGFILYWKNEDTENEIKIILPEVYFEKYH